MNCIGCKTPCCNPMMHDMINGLLAAKGLLISMKSSATPGQADTIRKLNNELARIGKALDRCKECG